MVIYVIITNITHLILTYTALVHQTTVHGVSALEKCFVMDMDQRYQVYRLCISLCWHHSSIWLDIFIFFELCRRFQAHQIRTIKRDVRIDNVEIPWGTEVIVAFEIVVLVAFEILVLQLIYLKLEYITYSIVLTLNHPTMKFLQFFLQKSAMWFSKCTLTHFYALFKINALFGKNWCTLQLGMWLYEAVVYSFQNFIGH